VTFGQYRIWKSAVLLVLLLWTAAVVAQTVFRRTPDASFQPVWQPFQSYVDALKAGGQKELLRSNFMNAVLFYPAGMLVVSLLPERWGFWRKLLIVLALFTVLSFAIELTQFYYCLGVAQTDDVIHNVLGAWVGASVFLGISKTIRYLKNRRGEIA
jgi:glycopeptide antibiotics resistance protein